MRTLFYLTPTIIFSMFTYWLIPDQEVLMENQLITDSGYCASDLVQDMLFNSNPDLLQLHEALENQLFLQKKEQPAPEVLTNYTLPVVVHIIHNNGSENISDAQVIQGIQDLNEAFANQNYYDQGTGVNTQIQFCLAKQDPAGNASTGINRVISSLTDMNITDHDIAVKDLSRWDPLEFINIWLVNGICQSAGTNCGIAGYAYLPSSHGQLHDGIVIESNFFGSSSANSTVIAHEMGHYLGLYHTFQSGCTNNDCLTDGDRVCDTPPDASTAAVTCGSSVNSCTTDTNSGFSTDQNDMYWNYMDYGDWNCYSAFTLGQANRMAFFIQNTRNSLLGSSGCQDPCLSAITANFTASSLSVNVGSTVTFTNTSTGATTYDWQIDGTSFANTTNASYTFPLQGSFDITLVTTNSDPNCEATFTVTIDVVCPVTATFTSSSTEVSPGSTVFFTNTSSNATTYEWYVNGNLEGTGLSFDFTFNTAGVFDVLLIASDGLCSDTSVVTIITVSLGGLSQTGYPVWALTAFNQPVIHALDWRDHPPEASTLSTAAELPHGQTGAAFDGCGNLVFYVAHTGSSDPFNLNIYAPDGTVLLDASTSNGPGLNAVRGGHEIQVVRVPETSNEWYILYNKWSTDNGAPLSNAAYNLAHQLYSKVHYDNNVLTVLDRDVELTDNNGIAYLYNDGKAISRTVSGDPNQHYLYACRRSAGSGNISIDRFLINQFGIQFNANTGNVNAGWWYLTGAGSPIELSPTEDKIAVMNRNQDLNRNDIIVFDALAFNNSAIEIISAGDLVLVADDPSYDLSDELNYDAPVSSVANDNSLNLAFLRNFERKLQDIEFSPNGRFLYLLGGGYVQGGYTNLTYLAQIDLDASPLEVRLQIQEPPFGTYTASSGRGCASSSSNCFSNWHGIARVESSFDGNLYFTKRNSSELYVIPDPNNFMPQNLVPSNIDLSTIDEPNIPTNSLAWLLPDQIDGFNYLDGGYQEVDFVVNKTDCDSACLAPYTLYLVNNGIAVDSFQVDSCPDTLSYCADTTLTYDLVDSVSGIVYTGAIFNAEVIYPDGRDYFDFSDNPYCEEICGNDIDDDNDGLIDCEDPDLVDSCCCLVPPLLDLGPDTVICENGIMVLDAGNQFVSYEWQDGSSDSEYTVWTSGTYWVKVLDGCGNEQTDTVEITIDTLNMLELGSDTTICSGDSVLFSVGGYSQYQWSPSLGLSCDTCAAATATPTATTTYTLIATTLDGCISVDSVTIVVEDCSPECISIFSDTLKCNGDGSYTYEFDIQNLTDQPVIFITFEQVDGYSITPSSISNINIPAMGTSGPQSITITPDQPLTDTTTLCFRISVVLEDGYCCHIDHCVVLDVCDPCEELSLEAISMDSLEGCCYEIDVMNFAVGQTFNKIRGTILTPGVTFENIGSSGSWAVTGTEYDAAWTYLPALPGGVSSGALQFCFDEISNLSQTPQEVLFEWMTTDSAGTEMVVCDTVLSFACQPCLAVSDPQVECLEDGTYDFSITVTNNANPPRTVTKIALLVLPPSGGAQFNTVDFPVTLNSGDSYTANTIIDSIGIGPLPPGTTIDYRVILFDENGDDFWCCHLDSVSIVLPDCADCVCEDDPEHTSLDEGIVSNIDCLQGSFAPVQPSNCYVYTWLVNGVAVPGNADHTMNYDFPENGFYSICLVAEQISASGEVCFIGETCLQIEVDCCIDEGLIDPTIVCSEVYEPVCGCDNITYFNACEAQNIFGIAAWTLGACPCQLSLDGQPVDISDVLLEWHNNDASLGTFLVERSDDGGSTWTTLAQVVSTPGVYHYSYLDENLTIVPVYYRITWERPDGSTCISNILEIDLPVQVAVYPNPAQEFVTVVANNRSKTNSEILVLDPHGKVVQVYRFGKEQKEARLDVSSFSPGIYFVQYVDNRGMQQVVRFVKMRF